MANYNRIDIGGGGVHTEKTALEAIRPGDLVELAAGGVQKHSTALGAAQASFAKHDRYQGKTIDDNYAADDVVFIEQVPNGVEVWAWLLDEENVAEGDLLESAGTGALQALTTGVAIAVAQEALNLTGATGDGRIVVRVI